MHFCRDCRDNHEYRSRCLELRHTLSVVVLYAGGDRHNAVHDEAGRRVLFTFRRAIANRLLQGENQTCLANHILSIGVA